MKYLLVLVLFLCSASIFAQDVIVKKDGSTIVCRVVELTSSEIVYKRWSDLNGSNYVMNRSEASAINYQDGKKINISDSTNLYMPGNQNNGEQQYNDRALLAMDQINNSMNMKIKKHRIYGWISSIIGVGVGVPLIIIGIDKGKAHVYDHDASGNALYRSSDSYLNQYSIPGIVISAGGIAASTYYFISAQKLEKQEKLYLQSSTLYQYDWILNNGSSLSTSINMLSDRTIGTNTFGLGLHYTF